jgi:hypothetical protein
LAVFAALAAPTLSYAETEESVSPAPPPTAAAPEPPAASSSSSPITDRPAPQLRRLQNTGVAFLALEMVGAVAVFATYSIAAGDPPESCRWCNPTGFDESFRDELVFDKSARKSAATVSHVLSAGGNRLSPFIAGGGGVLALGTGFLRIAADAHWTTDVLTGALLGTGLGVAVPLLLHRRVERGAPSLRLIPWVGRATGVELAVSL